MLGIFLMAMDGTIVASTYASIGSEFHRLENTSWIATGYLLTQTSFQYVCSALLVMCTHCMLVRPLCGKVAHFPRPQIAESDNSLQLSDIFGRKACIICAMCIFAFGSLICGLAQDMNVLVLGRAIAGIGGGGAGT